VLHIWAAEKRSIRQKPCLGAKTEVKKRKGGNFNFPLYNKHQYRKKISYSSNFLKMIDEL
jgi:hypothetical protein